MSDLLIRMSEKQLVLGKYFHPSALFLKFAYTIGHLT